MLSDELAYLSSLVALPVGRGVERFASAAALRRAAQILHGAKSVGIVTGFLIPDADPPSPETDGPPGAAALAAVLEASGRRATLVAPASSLAVVGAAVGAAGVRGPVVDAGRDRVGIERVRTHLRAAAVDVLISVEVPGPGVDGVPRSMRGLPVATPPFERLFDGGDPWRTIAIGDGGNEIGWGGVDGLRDVVAIGACVTPADALVVASVSNWGAHALAAALVLASDDALPGAEELRRQLAPTTVKAVVEACVDAGAVDGVTGLRSVSVDGLPLDVHSAAARLIRLVAGGD